MTHPPADHVAAAVELLDRDLDGPTTLGLTMRGASAASGASRSTLYRRWPTAAALNAEAARWAGTHADSWPTRLLAALEDDDLPDALGRALLHVDVDLGHLVRTTVSAWPPANAERAMLVEHERTWLAHLAASLDRAIARRGERWRAGASARLAALGLAAAIEGALLLDPGACGRASEEQRAAVLRRRSRLAAAGARYVHQLVEPGPPDRDRRPSDAALPPLLPSELGRGTPELLERIGSAVLAEPFGGPASIVPSRVVDAGRLARHLGISDRRLFQQWPTTADLNGALAEHVLRREHQRGEDLAARTLELGMQRGHRKMAGLLTDALREATTDPRARAHFRFSVATADPAVRGRVAEIVVPWRTAQRASFLAMLTVAGWYRPSDAGVELAPEVLFQGIAGAQRLVCSHPALAVEATAHRAHPDEPRSTIGLACLHLARAALPTGPGETSDPT